MKRFEFISVTFFLITSLISVASAEGLPANPWQNPQKVNAALEKKSENTVEQAAVAATDIWSKVRDSKEFRQWSMPEDEKNEGSEIQNLKNKAEMLKMLSNLNRVGYKLPDNYRQAVAKIPNKEKTEAKTTSYEQMLNQWKKNYGNAKNNSLNILDNSYRRVLTTIKNSTGVDINRTINDSINAFK